MTLPRIRSLRVAAPAALTVTWVKGGTATVDLAEWIATGGYILAPLQDPRTFQTARVSECGASVEWGDSDDLSIDAVHLAKLVEEQMAKGKGN